MLKPRLVLGFLILTLTACRPATPTPAPTCPAPEATTAGAINPEDLAQLREIRRLGSGDLVQAAFSPDGSLLAVGTSIGVYLYDTESGERVRFFETEGWAGSVAFSPDGSLLAVGLGGGSVELRRVSDSALLRSWRAHEGGAVSLAFTPDGHTLVTGAAAAGRARLWQVSDGTLLGTLPPEQVIAAITTLTISSDGSLLAAGTEPGVVYVWQYPEGTRRYILAGATDRSVAQLAFSPDGSLLAARAGDGTVALWRMSDGQAVALPEGFPQEVDTLAFGSDGTLWLAGGAQGVAQWQVPEGALLHTWKEGAEGRVMGLGFAPAGEALAVATQDGALWLWHSADDRRQQIAADHMGYLIWRVAFSPDGNTLAVADYQFGTIWLWRVEDGALLHTLEGRAWSLAFDPTGEVLAAGLRDGTLRLWRVADGTPVRAWQGHSDLVAAVAFSPEGSLLASGSWDDTARLWRIPDGTLVREMSPPQDPDDVRNLAFSPDGSLLAGALWSKVLLWQVNDGTVLRTIEAVNVVTDEPQGLTFDSDGTLLAWADTWGVTIWQVARERVLCDVHYSDVFGGFHAVFSPNRALFATGSEDDGLVRLRRVTDGTVLRTLEHSTGKVAALAFSPDGSLLAVGLDDGTVRLWGVQP